VAGFCEHGNEPSGPIIIAGSDKYVVREESLSLVTRNR
jgi:hypothetical protein